MAMDKALRQNEPEYAVSKQKFPTFLVPNNIKNVECCVPVPNRSEPLL